MRDPEVLDKVALEEIAQHLVDRARMSATRACSAAGGILAPSSIEQLVVAAGEWEGNEVGT